MKWKKLGKIFDPTHHSLGNGCTEFAKSPQAIEFDHFVRIYFSSQMRTEDGMYLSHSQFIDMDKEFKKIINISDKSVLELGELGTFDEHGIFPINPVRIDGKLHAYTSGWSRRSSVSIDMAIGLAVSNDDGLTFKEKLNGPILTASLHEPFLVGDPFVQKYNGQFHMWYIFGTEWKVFAENNAPDRIYKIAHASSNDGLNWQRESKPIIADKYIDESQALPTIIEIENKYHMFFCYRKSYDFRKNKDNAYRIGYAFSHDLINWTRNDELVGIDLSLKGWDSEMMCYPNVFKCNNKVYLLYNGNEFGRYGFGVAELEEN